jgi:hypothetical protein
MKSSATIIESSGKVVQYGEESDIFTCLLEHEIKATKADFKWTGPKLTEGQWDEMLTFFKWAYDTEKSEAQVRLFVHPTLGWKIWAFPQKGGTGMTTLEIDNEDFKLQRAAIGEGYIPFGTVHSHCAAPAFQSGVDTHDEKSVDGLHITVGDLDKKDGYSIHCRLYHKSNKFEPIMQCFWDIGEEALEKSAWVASLGYNSVDLENKEARAQMCVPPLADTTFPELWKTNYILPERSVVISTLVPGKWCWHCQQHTEHTPEACPDKNKPSSAKGKPARYRPNHGVSSTWWDEKTIDELWQCALENGIDDETLHETINEMGGVGASPFYQDILDICSDNYLTLAKLHSLVVEFDEEVAKKKAEQAVGPAVAKTPLTEEDIEYYQGYGSHSLAD